MEAVEIRRRTSSRIVSRANRFGGSYKTDMGGGGGGGGCVQIKPLNHKEFPILY